MSYCNDVAMRLLGISTTPINGPRHRYRDITMRLYDITMPLT